MVCGRCALGDGKEGCESSRGEKRVEYGLGRRLVMV